MRQQHPGSSRTTNYDSNLKYKPAHRVEGLSIGLLALSSRVCTVYSTRTRTHKSPPGQPAWRGVAAFGCAPAEARSHFMSGLHTGNQASSQRVALNPTGGEENLSTRTSTATAHGAHQAVLAWYYSGVDDWVTASFFAIIFCRARLGDALLDLLPLALPWLGEGGLMLLLPRDECE